MTEYEFKTRIAKQIGFENIISASFASTDDKYSGKWYSVRLETHNFGTLKASEPTLEALLSNIIAQTGEKNGG